MDYFGGPRTARDEGYVWQFVVWRTAGNRIGDKADLPVNPDSLQFLKEKLTRPADKSLPCFVFVFSGSLPDYHYVRLSDTGRDRSPASLVKATLVAGTDLLIESRDIKVIRILLDKLEFPFQKFPRVPSREIFKQGKVAHPDV